MTKGELIESIAHQREVTKAEAEKWIEDIFATIAKQVSLGDCVKIIGFGTFARINVQAKAVLNPRTLERMVIPAGRRIKFLPGQSFKMLAGARTRKPKVSRKAKGK